MTCSVQLSLDIHGGLFLGPPPPLVWIPKSMCVQVPIGICGFCICEYRGPPVLIVLFYTRGSDLLIITQLVSSKDEFQILVSLAS